MNVYDFDRTIYSGDSSLDFYFFAMKRHPVILFRMPGFFKMMLRYKSGKCDKNELKECFFSFLKDITCIQTETELFWNMNNKKIMPWYLERKQKSDVIISASPEFLLRIPCSSLNIDTLIATKIDTRTGKLKSENCKGSEKVKRFREKFPTEKIEKFYSDSVSDAPMAQLAKKAYLVKHGKITDWRL